MSFGWGDVSLRLLQSGTVRTLYAGVLVCGDSGGGNGCDGTSRFNSIRQTIKIIHKKKITKKRREKMRKNNNENITMSVHDSQNMSQI